MNVFGVPTPRTKSWSSPAKAYTDVPMAWSAAHTHKTSIDPSNSLSLYIYIYLFPDFFFSAKVIIIANH